MIERIEIEEVEVAANGSTNIWVYSEKGPFRILNLELSPEVAKDFFVTDIKVGKNSQFITTGAVAASYFAQRGSTEDLRFDKLPRGLKITISVTNMRRTPAKFAGVLRGNLEGDSYQVDEIPQVRVIAGLGHTIVPPEGKMILRVQPQEPFRPDCLVLPPEVCEHLHVNSVRVVGQNMTLDRSNPTDLLFPATDMKIADWLALEVENKTEIEQAFYGSCGGSLIIR
jgi:hypothetical protein